MTDADIPEIPGTTAAGTENARADRTGSRRHGPPAGHYEQAFGAFLRRHSIPLVAVDETRRAVLHGSRIKSFDLLVYPAAGPAWLVDVKGRQFPCVARNGSRHFWENWVTREDLLALTEWQEVFGPDFEARFVFAYHLQGDPRRWPTPPMQRWAERDYCFLTVALPVYERHCRRRSGRWDTVSVPAAKFRELAQPVDRLAFRIS